MDFTKKGDRTQAKSCRDINVGPFARLLAFRFMNTTYAFPGGGFVDTKQVVIQIHGAEMMAIRLISLLTLLLMFATPIKAQAPKPLVQLDIAVPITAIAPVILAPGQSPAAIAIAHGDAGLSLVSLTGEQIWQDPVPAKVVAGFKGQLSVYRDHEDQTRLDTIHLGHGWRANLVKSESPSPLAPTTLQRTAYASLGPVRIEGETLVLDDKSIALGYAIAAVAAAPSYGRLSEQPVVLVAPMDGGIRIYGQAALEAVAVPVR